MLSSLDKSSTHFWKKIKVLRKKSKVIPIHKFNDNTYITQKEFSNESHHICKRLMEIIDENNILPQE